MLDRVGMTYRAESGVVEALRDISVTVDRGELVALVGPSGCGKSTLLRIIAGLRPATTGRVAVAGRPVVRPVPAVGMVFQAPVLLRWRTVLDNVLLAAELSGLDPAGYRARAEALLKLVGLDEFAGKRPRELSGACSSEPHSAARSCSIPPLLLMDEPFGALDAMTRDEMNLSCCASGARARRAQDHRVRHPLDPEAVFLADGRGHDATARPGRPDLRVPLPRPRTVAARADPVFGALALAIHETLTAAR